MRTAGSGMREPSRQTLDCCRYSSIAALNVGNCSTIWIADEDRATGVGRQKRAKQYQFGRCRWELFDYPGLITPIHHHDDVRRSNHLGRE